LGISFREEYLCLQNKNTSGLLVSCTSKKSEDFTNITDSHLFLGYKPLIIGIRYNDTEKIPNEICLTFTERSPSMNFTKKGFKTDKNAIARLYLKKRKELPYNNSALALFEGIYGEHKLISYFHQFTNHVYHSFIAKKNGGFSLKGNLYEQVRIAYSIPRNISLISVCENNLVNLFPVDLHGALGNDYYVISLRIKGKACGQVEQIRRLVLSEMLPSSFKMVYSLGKNHMKDFTDPGKFELLKGFSELYKFPLPKNAIRYKELHFVEHFDFDTHRIHLFKVENSIAFSEDSPLFHIHNYFAQWKTNNSGSIDLMSRSE
jgi:hypothetical protein